MIEFPDNLCHKERQILSSHPTDTTKLAFENTPETLDVVGVNITAYHLPLEVIDKFMNVQSLLQTPVHLEAISIQYASGLHSLLDDGEDMFDIELPFQHFHVHFSRIP